MAGKINVIESDFIPEVLEKDKNYKLNWAAPSYSFKFDSWDSPGMALMRTQGGRLIKTSLSSVRNTPANARIAAKKRIENHDTGSE